MLRPVHPRTTTPFSRAHARAAGRRPRRSRQVLILLLAAGSPGPAFAQSFLDRPPNLNGTWVGDPGTLHFHFLHRFEASDAPLRKVTNTPTFLLAASLPARSLVGARYATNSLVRPGVPNEWEFFARAQPLSRSAGHPLDLAVHGGYNEAAESLDGEVTLGREVGPVRLLGVGRVLGDAYASGETRWALGGGAMLRLHEWVSVGGDLVTLADREDGEEYAWSAGLHVRIPYTPHTLSLHVSNANTTTLHGASRQAFAQRWGFEFTVPVTLSRYFGGRDSAVRESGEGAADRPTPPPGTTEVEVTMDNRLTFIPDTLRVRAGQTVRWRNTSDVVHTVTADPARVARAEHVRLPAGAEPFDSGDLAPGESFARAFTVPGTYVYFCIPHELAGMVGTVVVEP